MEAELRLYRLWFTVYGFMGEFRIENTGLGILRVSEIGLRFGVWGVYGQV